MVQTYNPNRVSISLGGHMASGFAEDSFLSIESSGDGSTKKVGCDGEVARSINPDGTYVVKFTCFQTSPTNSYLQKQYDMDRKSGSGMFPVLIKDLQGSLLFSCKEAWVVRPAARGYGREIGNREWEIQTGDGELSE